jgi:hypothetical protein
VPAARRGATEFSNRGVVTGREAYGRFATWVDVSRRVLRGWKFEAGESIEAGEIDEEVGADRAPGGSLLAVREVGEDSKIRR